MSSLYTIWYRFVNGERCHNEHLKSSVTCRWGGTSQDTLSKTNNVLVLKTRGKNGRWWVANTKYPIFHCFLVPTKGQTTNIFHWNRKNKMISKWMYGRIAGFPPKNGAWFGLILYWRLFELTFLDRVSWISFFQKDLRRFSWHHPYLWIHGLLYFCLVPCFFLFERKKMTVVYGCLLFLPYSTFSGKWRSIWKGNYCWRIHPFFTEPGLSGRIRVIRSCWWLLMVPKNPPV